MTALLMTLFGLPGARQAHEARLDPPRARPRPASSDLELWAEMWWVERGFRPWSGRTPLTGPDWRQPAIEEDDGVVD